MQSSAAGEPTSAKAAKPSRRWMRSFWQAAFVVLAIELGLVLLTLPWTPLWDNTIAVMSGASAWRLVFLNPYLRGAVSGLGLLDLWAAASEITHFRL